MVLTMKLREPSSLSRMRKKMRKRRRQRAKKVRRKAAVAKARTRAKTTARTRARTREELRGKASRVFPRVGKRARRAAVGMIGTIGKHVHVCQGCGPQRLGLVW